MRHGGPVLCHVRPAAILFADPELAALGPARQLEDGAQLRRAPAPLHLNHSLIKVLLFRKRKPPLPIPKTEKKEIKTEIKQEPRVQIKQEIDDRDHLLSTGMDVPDLPNGGNAKRKTLCRVGKLRQPLSSKWDEQHGASFLA